MKFVKIAGVWINAYAVTRIEGNDADGADSWAVVYFAGGDTLNVDMSPDAVEAALTAA